MIQRLTDWLHSVAIYIVIGLFCLFVSFFPLWIIVPLILDWIFPISVQIMFVLVCLLAIISATKRQGFQSGGDIFTLAAGILGLMFYFGKMFGLLPK